MDNNEIEITRSDIEAFAYQVYIDQKRSRERKTCLICRKRHNDESYRPLCTACYNEMVNDFPEKYLSRDSAFDDFCNSFDEAYRDYDENIGYIIITLPLSYSSPFTVIDVEATGDIHKNRRHFVITTGILSGSEVTMYQLIDFAKKKDFAKECRNVIRGLPPPLVAYNYLSERNWLKVWRGGWIELHRYEIKQTRKGKISTKPLKLKDVSFKWDDITGKDVVRECKRYRTTHDLIHVKRIAYHNFIDLLKEYLIALQDIKVYDYLHGKIWDYDANVLKTRHTCPKCYIDFYTKKELRQHISKAHKKRKKQKAP